MLTALKNLFPMEGGNVAFQKTEPSSAIIGLFMTDGLKRILEWKDYPAVEYVPFCWSFHLCITWSYSKK